MRGRSPKAVELPQVRRMLNDLHKLEHELRTALCSCKKELHKRSARCPLLRDPEADAAKVKILAPQVCEFETERFYIQVTEDRFMALSKPAANPAPLLDLVAGTFFVLEHTPVTALGLNRMMHFSLDSEEHWHQVGNKLAPKEAWSDILPDRPGMRSLSIESMLCRRDLSDRRS